MPLWLLLLLGGAVVVAAGKSRTISDAAIIAVTKHAVAAENDVTVLRKLQDLLSHAGYFDLATLVKARADWFDAPALKQAVEGIQAPKTISNPTDVPYYKAWSMPELQAELVKVKANYASVSQTQYALTHPQFLASYQQGIADLEAWIKAHGGAVPPQVQQVQQVQQVMQMAMVRV